MAVTFVIYHVENPGKAHNSPLSGTNQSLPATPDSYLGLYARGVPVSYTGVKKFTTETGIKPGVLSYYSGWTEPFQVGFARIARDEGAVPLVQINPLNVSIAAIAAGRYDSYLTTYAKAVRSYGHPVILSFGHEMNGYWYTWGYTHTSPVTFVAAWRHIVTLFRSLRTQNVTWLWTINTIHPATRVPAPEPWWPGRSYVNWIGIDGYFTSSSSTFASVFGPTIVSVRALTRDPILIAETSAAPASGQPAKIANLFAGIHLYGLLGFVWFDAVTKTNWRLSSPAAIAAFHRGAASYHRPTL
jgi:mannan endo-1,4-beta-mannosidase